ncbi:MAG: hypothetical protein EBV69_05660 [Oxalobacteraceae bacterium]|nr:hypothetical protein [Oxalobacteraceae bacterium]
MHKNPFERFIPGQKIKPATLACGGFLVKRAHHAEEFSRCHHASHQPAKLLIQKDFFITNK